MMPTMRGVRRLLAVLVLAALAACEGSPTMLIVGDSNVANRPAAIRNGFSEWSRDVRAVPGAGIRSGDCATCLAVDWAALLADAGTPSTIVVELGVNDTGFEGADGEQGWAGYDAKVDWLLAQLPAGVPVYWSNLPCDLLRERRAEGCAAVNAALDRAAADGEIELVDWAAVALPEDFDFDDVHLTYGGALRWAGLVAETITAGT